MFYFDIRSKLNEQCLEYSMVSGMVLERTQLGHQGDDSWIRGQICHAIAKPRHVTADSWDWPSIALKKNLYQSLISLMKLRRMSCILHCRRYSSFRLLQTIAFLIRLVSVVAEAFAMWYYVCFLNPSSEFCTPVVILKCVFKTKNFHWILHFLYVQDGNITASDLSLCGLQQYFFCALFVYFTNQLSP